jgi:hypothetical protein
MKNRTKLSFIVTFAVVLLMGLTAQSVFAEKWNPCEWDFIYPFEKSDLTRMEQVLKQKDSKTDMSAILYSVLFGYRSGSGSLWYLPEGRSYEPLNNDKRTAFAIIELLIKYGVDLNKCADYFYFRVRGHPDVFIGDYKGDPMGRDGPLTEAIYERFSREVLQLMLDVGASPNKLDEQKHSPLYAAIAVGNISIVRLLLEYGANVNQFGNGIGSIGSSYPLTVASTNLEITRLLVEAGARVNQQEPNWFGGVRTAAEFAHRDGAFDVYLYLKEHGATWTAPNHAALVRQYGNSPPPVASYDTPSAPAQSSNSTPTQSSGERTAQAITQGLQQLQDTLRGSLDTGRYRMSGGTEEITFTGMANNGNLYYKDPSGKTSSGTYSISGNRLTINVLGRSFFYTITSRTSFSGNGDEWFYAGR